jgi:hypothetical protein
LFSFSAGTVDIVRACLSFDAGHSVVSFFSAAIKFRGFHTVRLLDLDRTYGLTGDEIVFTQLENTTGAEDLFTEPATMIYAGIACATALERLDTGIYEYLQQLGGFVAKLLPVWAEPARMAFFHTCISQ